MVKPYTKSRNWKQKLEADLRPTQGWVPIHPNWKPNNDFYGEMHANAVALRKRLKTVDLQQVNAIIHGC